MRKKTFQFSPDQLKKMMDENQIMSVSQLQKLLAVEMGVDAPTTQAIYNWVKKLSTPDGRYLPVLASVLKCKMEHLFEDN